ncbi:MAG: SCO family protein [Lautropia sp.]
MNTRSTRRSPAARPPVARLPGAHRVAAQWFAAMRAVAPLTAAMLVVALPAAAPAHAGLARPGLSQRELDAVRAAPPADAALPPAWRALTGRRPALLIFADFDCVSLCDPVLAETAAGLAATGLDSGRDFRLVVVGIDPDDPPSIARDFVDARIPTSLAPALVLRQPDPRALASLTHALGYRFVRDDSLVRFAHPAVRYVLTADGRVSRMLPAFGVAPADLRRALVEAGEGAIGSFGESLVLACYGFDPVTGRWSLAIERLLLASGVATALALALGVGVALRRERARAAAGHGPHPAGPR